MMLNASTVTALVGAVAVAAVVAGALAAQADNVPDDLQGLSPAEQGYDKVKADLLRQMEAEADNDPAPSQKPTDAGLLPEEPVRDDEFETGIFEDGEVPASSVVMLGVNRWSGKVGDTRWIVYAGYAGWDEPDVGQLIATPMVGRGFGQGKTIQVKDSGALRVVDVDGSLVHLKAEKGGEYTLDLTTLELR